MAERDDVARRVFFGKVIERRVGDFTLTLRPAARSVTVAGRGRVELVGFDEVARRLAFYRALVEWSRTGAFYLGNVAAWECAAGEVARLSRMGRGVAA